MALPPVIEPSKLQGRNQAKSIHFKSEFFPKVIEILFSPGRKDTALVSGFFSPQCHR